MVGFFSSIASDELIMESPLECAWSGISTLQERHENLSRCQAMVSVANSIIRSAEDGAMDSISEDFKREESVTSLVQSSMHSELHVQYCNTYNHWQSVTIIGASVRPGFARVDVRKSIRQVDMQLCALRIALLLDGTVRRDEF